MTQPSPFRPSQLSLSLSLYPFIPCYSFACSVLAYPNPVSPLMSTLAFRFMLRASLRFLLLKRNASPKLITEDIPIYIWTYIYRCVCVAARATCRISFASPTGSQGDVKVRAACAHLPLFASWHKSNGAWLHQNSLLQRNLSALHSLYTPLLPSLLLLHSLVRNFHVNNIECSVTYLASIRNSSAMQSPQALEWTVSPWYFSLFPPFPSLVYFQFLIVASLVLTVIEIASRTSNGQRQFLHSLPFSPSLCSGFVWVASVCFFLRIAFFSWVAVASVRYTLLCI